MEYDLAGLYILGMLAFAVVILINWLRLRKEICRYRINGFSTGGTTLGLQLIAALLIPYLLTEKRISLCCAEGLLGIPI
jgi:hypothetical protein